MADASENCVVPLKNGWVKPQPLAAEPSRAEYRLGHWLGGKDSQELALPVVQANGAGGWQAAICADTRFSAQFTLHQDSKSVAGEIRYRYLASRVPIAGVETRTFGFSLRKTPPTTEPFGSTMDAFFRLMLPDVRPGPQWLHEIYLIKYDYLSDDGKGWRQDVETRRSRGHKPRADDARTCPAQAANYEQVPRGGYESRTRCRGHRRLLQVEAWGGANADGE